MAYSSQYAQRNNVSVPAPRPSAEITRTELGGLDLTSPYDSIKKGRTPFARNFRLYAEEKGDRRVAVSNRKGSGHYLVPQGEALNVAAEDNLTPGDAVLGIKTNWHAQSFVPTLTQRLTMISIPIKNVTNARGPVIIEIRSDNSGVPGTKIADSSILNSDIGSIYAWREARFIEAPLLTSGATYWIVAYMQDDGLNNYYWRTAPGTSLSSQSSGMGWDAESYSLNFRTYLSPDMTVKGIARYTPSTGFNRTVLALGSDLYYATDSTGALTSFATGLNASATNYSFTSADNKLFWVNNFDNLQTWNGTTVETITHTQLPILKYIAFHKNVLWGVTKDDPNKLVYSVAPVETDATGKSWYYGWRSTNFGYVPAPKAADPITAIVPFQDTLVVFTASTKFVVYGSNAGDVQPRQATGKKGAVSARGVYADENYVYFVSNDGFYRWNGAQDELISDMTDRDGGSIQSEFDGIPDKTKVSVTKWKRGVRFYYASSGSSANNRCAIFHTTFNEWMLDTDAYVKYAVPWLDADDSPMLVEASSTAPTAHYAEMADHNLGKQIDFIYKFVYDSLGSPGKKKRIVKMKPLVEGEGSDYSVQIGVDKDLEDTPRFKDFPLETEGATVGEFTVGDGTVVGGKQIFKPTNVRTTGYAYYWQVIIKRKAVLNPVNIMGYVLSYREKRL